MKKYISRPDAEQKYRIRYKRLLTYEEQRILTVYDADLVGYAQRTNRGGQRVKWVYDEDQVAALALKISPDASLGKRDRKEAKVFDLLDKGVDLPGIVRQLNINGRIAEQIRDFYIREKDAVVIPNDVVREIRAMGFSFTRENAATTILSLIEKIRELNARVTSRTT